MWSLPLAGADVGGRGKSGLHRAGGLLTAAGGNPRESATENIPPVVNSHEVRVKRRGKSSPLLPVTMRVCKPPLEKGGIGFAFWAAHPIP